MSIKVKFQGLLFLGGPLGCLGIEAKALGRCGEDVAPEPDVVRGVKS